MHKYGAVSLYRKVNMFFMSHVTLLLASIFWSTIYTLTLLLHGQTSWDVSHTEVDWGDSKKRYTWVQCTDFKGEKHWSIQAVLWGNKPHLIIVATQCMVSWCEFFLACISQLLLSSTSIESPLLGSKLLPGPVSNASLLLPRNTLINQCFLSFGWRFEGAMF